MADVHSIAGNKLRPYSEIGMPYHGLATNGTLPTSNGDKSIPQPSFYGPCQVIRHPLAPGPDRNPNQVANDTAKGFDWRNYALLTGPGHGVNGSAELGSTQWLYCDAGGNTWQVGIGTVEAGQAEQVTHFGEFVTHLGFDVTNTGTLNNDELLIQVVLEKIWGRFGKVYEFERGLLGEFLWSPDIPSWYGGAISAADVVAETDITRPECVVVNGSGSQALLHLFVKESTQGDIISGQVYPETQPYTNGNNGINPEGPALIGIVGITITGIGDINDNGNGLAAVLADDSRFESELIVSRTRGNTPGTGVEDWRVVRDPVPDCPNPFPPEETTSYNPNTRIENSGDTAGTDPGTTWEYEAILYKTFDGDVRRVYEASNTGYWEVSWTNSESDNYNLTNDSLAGPAFTGCSGGGGGDWYLVNCSTSGYLVEERRTGVINRTKVDYNVFGQVYGFDLVDDDGSYTENNLSDPGLPQCPRAPFPGGNDFDYRDTTLNGQVLENFAQCFHEWRVTAPNLHYVVIDQPQLTGTLRDMIETAVGVNEAGVASEKLNQTTPHGPTGTTRVIPDLRELAWSYQPVTEQATHGPALLFAANTNDIFQYV